MCKVLEKKHKERCCILRSLQSSAVILKSAGNLCQPSCFSPSQPYQEYIPQTMGEGVQLYSSTKITGLKSLLYVCHSYQPEWHIPWLYWDWANGCILHEIFPFPSGLVGDIKCMHWIKSISNCELILSHSYLNQIFHGTILFLCVMHSGIFLFYFKWRTIQATPYQADFSNH